MISLNLIKVEGDSMSPNIKQGSFVFIFKSPFTKFKTGDLVVVDHSQYGRIIKRVYSSNNNQQFSLTGDNPDSLSSEKMGLVNKRQLCGKVFYISQKAN